MTYVKHSDLSEIDDLDTSLWRYVDLYRYLDLLQSSELHLARADQMEDRWEGSYSKLNLQMRPHLYGDQAALISSAMAQSYAYSRNHTFINCWYIGDHESYAMWKLYDASGKGVAIRTTVGRLQTALSGGHEVHGTRVTYAPGNYDQTFISERNMLHPYATKRSSFAHENEYRLLAMWFPKVLEMVGADITKTEPDTPPPCLRETVDLDRLLETVYVSPDAPGWVAKVVRDITAKYRPSLEVRHSDLAADPVY